MPTHTDLFATWSNGRALISDVRSNSGSDRAGLRPGMELVAINGESTETAVRSIEPRFLARADPAARQWALQVALAGRRDSGVTRLLIKMGDQLRELEFVSGAPNRPRCSRIALSTMRATCA